jgi:hypothetical protein
MQLRIRSLPPEGVYEVDTPGAAVVIREPGVYRIEVRPDADVTTLVVRAGAADIYGNRASLDVRSGEMIVFSNGGESYDYRSIAQQDDSTGSISRATRTTSSDGRATSRSR